GPCASSFMAGRPKLRRARRTVQKRQGGRAARRCSRRYRGLRVAVEPRPPQLTGFGVERGVEYRGPAVKDDLPLVTHRAIVHIATTASPRVYHTAPIPLVSDVLRGVLAEGTRSTIMRIVPGGLFEREREAA